LCGAHQNLDGVLPAVGDVAVEEVRVRRRRLAVLLEHPQEVGELPVRVAADDQLAVGLWGGPCS
jgi:hypothetical protein